MIRFAGCLSIRRAVIVLVVMGAACFAAPLAAGQMELAVIQGTVKDEAGKPLEGVTFRLKDIGRGRETAIKSDKNGKFYRRGLQAVEYELVVEKEGYQPINDKIRLSAGENSRRFDFKLVKAAPEGAGDFAKGVEAYNKGDNRRPRRRSKRRWQKAPDLPEIRVNLALAYFKLQRTADAVAQLEKAASLAPDKPAGAVSARRRVRRDAVARQGDGGVREGACEAVGSERSAGVGSDRHAWRGVLRQGRERQSDRAVRKGARRKAECRRPDARARQSPFQQGRRRRKPRVVPEGGRRRRPGRPKPRRRKYSSRS